jgi:hypothetical protein
VREIQAGDFKVKGLYLYRWEGFKLLPAVMYLLDAVMLSIVALAFVDLIGAEVLR